MSRTVALIAWLASVQIAVAQCRGWSALDGPPRPFGPSVRALVTWDPDGPGASPEVLVVAGEFSTIGGIAADGIATWNGVSWQPLGAGLGHWIKALCVFNGELIAGTLGGTVPSIARWDGSSWIPMGLNDRVESLVVYDGELVAGGAFTMAGGVAAARVARWNGSVWQPLGNGTNGSVDLLEVWNGDLVAAGAFTEAGGIAAYHMARWDGSSWSSFGAAPYQFQSVFALTVHDGEVYAGGTLYQPGGPDHFVARWDGAIWQPIGVAEHWVDQLVSPGL
jgi:hypothetical protein